MNWPIQGALAPLFGSLIVSAGVIAGCISLDPPPVVCEPPCAFGSYCTATGCVGGRPDFIVYSRLDMAGCHPPCTGSTPHCMVNHCAACALHSDCPAGMTCTVGQRGAGCTPGCTDSERCQGLGLVRPGCCGRRCVDLATSDTNCGTCSLACGSPGDAKVCANGVCVDSTCARGTGDCNNDPADGCEVLVSVDINHCGDCGTTCYFAHAMAGCDGKFCFPDRCDPDFKDCNGTSVDGCETEVDNDPANCGACRTPCPQPAHQAIRCVKGACMTLGCDRGFVDCDGNAGNGCEVATTSDAKNCGGCGKACGAGQVCVGGGCSCQQCAIPHARARCPGNQCALDSCADGWGDCNGNPADGCETDLTVDAARCGACGMACPKDRPACVDGACVAINSRVLIVHSSMLAADVKRSLESTAALAAIDEFDASIGTPALAQLRPYGALLVYSDAPFKDPVSLGNVLADYFDAGGSVVLAAFADAAPATAVQGRFGTADNGYLLIEAAGQEQPSDALGSVLEPQSPLMLGVTRLTAQSAYRSRGSARPGAVSVAEWKGGRPLVLRGSVKARNIAALNLFPPSVRARADLLSGDLAALLRNALLYR